MNVGFAIQVTCTVDFTNAIEMHVIGIHILYVISLHREEQQYGYQVGLLT